jgi:hypothetical protein
VKFSVLVLTIIASIPLAAQDPPSPLIYIYREEIKPGKIAAYTRIEEAAARFCLQAKCPNPYVAISSMTGPSEVWWINGFDSIDTMDKVRQAYASNEQIAQQLNSVAESKADLAFPGRVLLARFRDDLSFSAATTFAYARFISISVVQVRPGQLEAFEKTRLALKAAEQRSGRTLWVYQVTSGTEDGTFLVMTPGRTMQEIRVFATSEDRIPDPVLSSETRLYAVSPSLSMPAQSWLEADPDFWKHP